MNNQTEAMISKLIQPLQKYLKQDDAIEFILNAPCEVCIERERIGWEYIHDKELDINFWSTLCHVLANANGIKVDELSEPRVSTLLPGGHRIELIVGNRANNLIAVAIRIRRNIVRKLIDFGISENVANYIIDLSNQGCNMILSGGTGAGKTTTANCIIDKIDHSKRIITIEDARELVIPNMKLSKQFFVSRNDENPRKTYSQMIDHAVRMRPDIVMVGEISVNNAFPALRLLNTGHKGFLATIHANSPMDVIHGAFPQNIQMAGYDVQNVSKWLSSMLDIIIQLHSTPEGKRITEIYCPRTDERKVFIDFKEEQLSFSNVIKGDFSKAKQTASKAN